MSRILVTGAMSGIGAALTAQLRSDGHTVLTLDRTPGADIVADLSDIAAIDSAAARIEGPLTGIAHVAGVPGTAPPAVILAVNTVAPARLNHLLEPKLADGAAIVIVASVTGHRCLWPEPQVRALIEGGAQAANAIAATVDGVEAYQISKRGALVWASMAAAALHPRGIRVNAVSPGPVETPILRDFEASIGKDRLDAAAALTGRHGRPDEIAEAVRWLLSRASRWVNGIELKVDGGYHALRSA
ncbi:SDR family oxidoreductase [Sandaracinobacteroides saxicola]|uniref:SDR family oxidoreductase n=1 Tax=Sandaracinobacteroides saxicola TaxID=2759707 RepID=A0A7G5IJH9_9SPHN|nr:SDR family oxidoreductase [Sandaracinobacteroides saxicola]QMW23521.1 SDR family oxidoreductase [Sandaracinobacteroides saxicola]